MCVQGCWSMCVCPCMCVRYPLPPGHTCIPCPLDIHVSPAPWTHMYPLPPGHTCIPCPLDIHVFPAPWTYMYSLPPGHTCIPCPLDAHVSPAPWTYISLYSHKDSWFYCTPPALVSNLVISRGINWSTCSSLNAPVTDLLVSKLPLTLSSRWYMV